MGMSYNKFKISVEVKNAKLLAATKKVASLLRESFKWNPDFPEAYVNRGRSTGELIVGGISRELLENDLRKTTEKIRLQKSSSKWHLKCIITELAAVATEKSPEAESPPRLDKEIPLHEGHLQVSQQGAYKLLLTSDAMEGLSAIGEKSKVTFSSVLHDLAQGKWETWEKGSCSGFSSWKEDKGSQELFTFFDPVSKQLIIWGRAWSIDLFGQVSYPKGTYYQKSPPPDKYSLHIVLYAIKEMDSPPSSEFFYEGINYVEEEGLNNGVTIRSMTPEDQIRYSEELFLLSRSRINDLLEGTQRGLPLHMSEEQVIALQPGGPLLVSGEAGSGKTIIITQWLVMNHLQSSSNHERGRESINQLFVTFSKRLRDKAMEDFERMLPLAFRDHETRFITNRDLVKEILTESGLS